MHYPNSRNVMGSGGQLRGLFAVVLAAGVLAGCAQTQKVATIDRLSAVGENPRVLLMEPDITINLMTASGLSEPQAEWTRSARGNFLTAVDAFGKTRKVEIVRMPEDVVLNDTELAYERLHAAVGTTILINYYGQLKLPTKAGGFDWSLGSGVGAIKEKYGADYALFSHYRDTNASGGRMAMAVLFAAAGVGLQTGGQGGFASLVDLTTGDVVWFNFVPAGTGDLRSPNGAQAVVRQLFSGLPER